MAFRRGRCLMRDFEGRVSPVQIDLGDPRLLAALDTTPSREPHDDADTAADADVWHDDWADDEVDVAG
jgi:hypothetical protein